MCVRAHLYLDNCVISAIFGKFSIQIGRFPCTVQHKTLTPRLHVKISSVPFYFVHNFVFFLFPLHQSNLIRIFDQKMPRNRKLMGINATTTHFDELAPHCTINWRVGAEGTMLF